MMWLTVPVPDSATQGLDCSDSANIRDCSTTWAIHGDLSALWSLCLDNTTLEQACRNTHSHLRSVRRMGIYRFLQWSWVLSRSVVLEASSDFFWIPEVCNLDCSMIWTNFVASKSSHYRPAIALGVIHEVYLQQPWPCLIVNALQS